MSAGPSSQPEACDLLIEGGIVIALDAEDRRLADGAVAIKDSRIAAVGHTASLRARFAPRERIDARGHFVMPGFVNVHNHTPIIMVRGMMEDIGVAPSYTTAVPPVHALSREETYHLSRLALFELMRFGSTTVVDSFHDPEPLAQALLESGLRGDVSGRIMDVDSKALAAGGPLRFDPAIGEKRLQQAVDVVTRWHGKGDGRLRAHLAPHATNTCSPDLLRRARSAGESLGVRFHVHVAQSEAERDQVVATHGLTPVELLAETGMLDDRLVAAHCLFVTDADIARLGGARASLAHVPIGNAKSGFVARVLDLERAGMIIAIGSDTVSADMFESIRMAISLARIRGAGYELKARHVMGWATHGAASALGLGAEVGRLAPGMKADIVLVDANAPNLAPIIDGVGIVAYGARGSDVDTVIVDGEVLLRDRKPTRFDGAEVVRRGRQVIADLWRRQGASPLS